MPQPGEQPGTSIPAGSGSIETAHGPAMVTRERILSTAHVLFSRRSIRDVGVNELIDTSGVAKSTFYRHFPSKDELVQAVLALQDEVWFTGVVAEAASQRYSRKGTACHLRRVRGPARKRWLQDQYAYQGPHGNGPRPPVGHGECRITRQDTGTCAVLGRERRTGAQRPVRPGVAPAAEGLHHFNNGRRPGSRGTG